jgi:competence protein ComEC
MPLWTIAFLIGVTALTFLPHLPSIYFAWAILPSGLVLTALIRKKIIQLLIVCCLGFAWALLFAQHELAWTLPEDLQGKNVAVIGTIASIPEKKSANITFDFAIQGSALVRLSWRDAPPTLRVGDVWQLNVRLKNPRGFWDTASFDYQAWLFERGVRATGYIETSNTNHLISSNNFEYFIDRTREDLANSITNALHNRPLKGLIAALAVGVRDNITESQWATLRGTGTNHLFAIAGLHIGFVSGIIYALVSFFWRRAGRLPLYLATPQVAALGALISAILYSALAGFALPTQRAIIMIAVFLVATLWRKHLPPWRAWSLALLLVLLFDPFAVLSDSFWLSFGAVAFIIYGNNGRLKKHTMWWHWARIQWIVAVGLIPLSLLFFHQASLAGFIANAIAIPWVGFITLPLTLLGNIVWLVIPPAGNWLWLLAEYSLEIIWRVLMPIADLNGVQWIAYINNSFILIAALVAVMLLLAPKNFPARWLGIIWALPLLFWTPTVPHTNEVWFTLLDVGQGLSAIVRTAHHTLIYDTGPRFSANFDAGNAVILPYLQAAHLRNIDLLVISSGDNAHFGGAASVLQQIPVIQVLTSVPELFKPGFAVTCQTGQRWQWDGVQFQILNNSCVLRIDNNAHNILLSGNTGAKGERYLKIGNKIYSTVNDGAISFKLTGKEAVSTPQIYQKHFWDF